MKFFKLLLVVVFLVFGSLSFSSAFAQTETETIPSPSLPVWIEEDMAIRRGPEKPQPLLPLPQEPFESSVVLEPTEGPGDLVAIIVNAQIFPELKNELAQFVTDLQEENWRVAVEAVKGGKPQDLRELLKRRLSQGLRGVILIGDLPVPWFEMGDDFGDFRAEFPCDFFYADLDGEWLDQDGNGISDLHLAGTGDKNPEIWVGRLTFSPMAQYGAEVALLKNYFAKNHYWRSNWAVRRQSQRRALVYIDDTWQQNFGPNARNEVNYIYPTVDLVSEPSQTTAVDYSNRLQQEDYEFVTLWAHGNIGIHSFDVPGAVANWVSIADVINAAPRGRFYVLYSCSTANYTGSYRYDGNGGPYIGAAYLISGNGLVLVGPTKVGGIINTRQFYYSLASGQTFGDSFLAWWFSFAGFFDDQLIRRWNYGLVLLGDPTLKVTESAELTPPIGANIYTYSWVQNPVLSDFPWLYQPIGMGPIESGVFNLQVKLPRFSKPMDIYLIVYAPEISDNIFFVAADSSIVGIPQTETDQWPAWLRNFRGPFGQSIFGNWALMFFPPGRYYFAVIATPAGTPSDAIVDFYCWIAHLER